MGDSLAALGEALADRYRIEREIGHGGMALVYLAEDLKHRRRVAIKVLRPELAAVLGTERFLAEIRTTASLQHPHILPLFDSGVTTGSPAFVYYVMPYVAGESLRERLNRERQLSLGSAVRLTSEVAGALDYAHRQGVIHRDVKPENILLQEESALISDFGIALAVRQAAGARLTESGISIGTPQYMSPEQAAGEATLGPESDTYSLAAVCYEMLAGEPPFTGPTAQAIHAKQFRETPPRLSTVRDVPAGVEQALTRGLSRNPADRPSRTVEFGQAVSEAAAAGGAPAAPVPRRVVGRRVALATGLLAILALGALLFPRGPMTPSLGAVRPLTFENGLEVEPSFSPDGRYIAYAGGDPLRVYLRQAGSRPVRLIPDDSAPERRPRWSPDGSRILYDSDRRVFVVPALGGVPRLVVAEGWSPTWAPDSRRFSYALEDTVFIRDVESGDPKPVATVKEPSELAWSPDGRWIALVSGNNGWDGPYTVGNIAQTRLLLLEVQTGRLTELTDRGALNVSPAWAPDSRRLFFVSNRGGSRDVFVLKLDGAGRPAGPPVRLSTGLDAHGIAVSAAGDRLAYSAYHARGNIWRIPIPRTGPVGLKDAVQLTSGNQTVESIMVSPDGAWLYFTADRAGNSDIYRLPLPAGEPEQLTRDQGDDFAPALSPDGKWLAFYSLRAGTRDLWLMPNGSGEAVRLTDDPGEEYFPHWSPDGQSLCYGEVSAGTGNSVRILRRQGAGWSPPLTIPWATRSMAGLTGCFGWSADGTWLLVPADNGGIAMVGVDSLRTRMVYLPDPNHGRPLARNVILSPDRSVIYFRSDNAFWSLPLAGGRPRELVRLDDPNRRSTRDEWATDGSQVFFSLGDPQSDIFLADLSGSR